MMSGQSRTSLVLGIFLAATLIAFVILNRWLVTELGLLSYGRVWQLYISYLDFGFARRAFLGTILYESGFSSVFANEYHFAITIHHIAIAILAGLIFYYCISRKISNLVFLSSVAFSPALIIHSGYNTGALDVFVLIFATINILFVRNLAIFSLIAAAGVLTHELSIFTFPAQLLAILTRKGQEPNFNPFKVLIAPSLIFICTVTAVAIFGKVDAPLETVEQIMQQKMPIAAGQHDLWSGYIEIASTIERNAMGASQKLVTVLQTKFIWLFIPLIYLFIVLARLWTYSEGPIETAVISVAVLAPLLTALVATDYHRWIVMSANMGILLTLILATRSSRSYSPWNIPLIAFCLLAPFGAAQVDLPFPMHQFFLERIIN